jgi:O-antigen/teichoic acid export membrane protein
MSGNIFMALSTLLIAALITSWNSLAAYGEFVTFQAIYFSFSIVAKPVTWLPFVKFYDEYSPRKIVSFSFLVESFFFLSLCVVLFAVCSIVNERSGEIQFLIDNVAIVLMASFLFNNGVVLGYFRATSRYGMISNIIVVSSVIKIVATVFLYKDIRLLFIFTVVVDIVIWSLALFYVVKKVGGIKIYVVPTGYAKASIYGYFNQLLDLPITQLDRVVVGSLLGMEAAGAFNLIRRVSQVLNQVADPLYQLSFKELTSVDCRNDVSRRRIVIKKVVRIGLCVSVVALTTSYLFFDLMNEYLFSGGLQGYQSLFIVFVGLSAITVMFVWVTPFVIAEGYDKENVYITVIANGVFLAVLVLVCSYMNLNYVYLAFSIQIILMLSMKILLLKRHL